MSVAVSFVGAGLILGGLIYYSSNEQDDIPHHTQIPEMPAPIPTTPKQKPSDIGGDSQLRGLLESFKRAYEARDFNAIQKLSQMDVPRIRYVKMMLDNYSTINISTELVSATDQLATAMLTYDKLVKPDGETVILKPIAQKIKISIKKEGNEWTKVVW